MKVQLISIVLLATTVSGNGYHETIGVPAATAIKQLEHNLSYSARITQGGLYSMIHWHPFFGGLIILLASELTSVCGSTLLTNTKLVTAAHCWDDGVNHATQLEVVLGSARLFSGGTRLVTNIVAMHEDYNSNTVQNDIAIITVSTVEFSDHIKPISLPVGALLKSSYEGVYGCVVGYGVTSDSAGIFANQSLRFAVVSVSSNDKCKVYGHYFSNTSMICSNAALGGPCGGDSGGPLFIYGHSLQKYLIGVVSYGSLVGCNAGHPTVYTKISSYIDWIKARI